MARSRRATSLGGLPQGLAAPRQQQQQRRRRAADLEISRAPPAVMRPAQGRARAVVRPREKVSNQPPDQNQALPFLLNHPFLPDQHVQRRPVPEPVRAPRWLVPKLWVDGRLSGDGKGGARGRSQLEGGFPNSTRGRARACQPRISPVVQPCPVRRAAAGLLGCACMRRPVGDGACRPTCDGARLACQDWATDGGRPGGLDSIFELPLLMNERAAGRNCPSP